ncbi:retroviral-like aspartic protease family protein [Variovorax paradoxus]|uniref:retroviral-like aspartic protease family protein n=1 Tax=Variovorax paradoxus TaxID=34073 RepID=UPI001ABCF0AC
MDEHTGSRREPQWTGDIAAAAPGWEPGFLRDDRERGRKAGPLLWGLATLSLAALEATTLFFGRSEAMSPAFRIGTALGALLWPFVVVLLCSLWDHRFSQRRGVKVFAWTCLVLAAVSFASIATTRGYWQRWLNKDNLTAEDFRGQAGRCAREADLACEEANWQDYVRLLPGDTLGLANLGMAQARRGKHQQAVENFERAEALGEGAYDLFAFHADSLSKLGRGEEAIAWSYKALAAQPALVDVRARLARLLVAAGRPYEALSLLQAYDSQAQARGSPLYFAGQRIAIETAIDQSGGAAAPERAGLRLPAYGGHFFAPVNLGEAKAMAFMVDTGATRLSLAEETLRQSKAAYRVVDPSVRMFTADGRRVVAKAIVIDAIRIGRFELKNVQAITCADCLPLLGQSVLSMFDMRSSKVQGLEFMTLVKRGG